MKTFCVYLTKIKYYKQLKVCVYPSPLWRNTFCPKSGLYYFSEMSLCWYMYIFLGNKYYYFHVFRFWHKWYHECTYSSTAWFLYFTLSKRDIFSVWVNHNLYIHSLVDRCLSYFQNFNYWKCCSEHSYMWALALRSTNFCVPVLSVVREVDWATGVNRHIFSFIRHCWLLSNDYDNFHLQCMRVPVALCAYQHLVISSFGVSAGLMCVK